MIFIYNTIIIFEIMTKESLKPKNDKNFNIAFRTNFLKPTFLVFKRKVVVARCRKNYKNAINLNDLITIFIFQPHSSFLNHSKNLATSSSSSPHIYSSFSPKPVKFHKINNHSQSVFTTTYQQHFLFYFHHNFIK